MNNKSKHPLYYTWVNMKRRCNNSKATSYQRYGGRGIEVCKSWNKSFENFVTDMGDRPASNYTLDRIDNDGNYCKNNCKWSSRDEQSRNRSTNRLYEYKGQLKLLKDWAIELDINKSTLEGRAWKGLLGEDLFNPKRLVQKSLLSTDEKKRRVLAASTKYRLKNRNN